MGTKNDPGKYDCYDHAKPDEPLFVLLGRDKHAPTLVWLWAILRELDEECTDKVCEAKLCAIKMAEWQISNGKKPVGLGKSILAGVFQLIRSANQSLKPEAHQTTVDDLKVMLEKLL